MNRSSSVPRRRWRIAVPVLLVLTFLGLPAARHLIESQRAEPDDARAPVVIGVVRRTDAERIVRYTGNLTPEATTTIVPKVGGRIVGLRVGVNQHLAAGEIIGRVEDDVLRLQVSQARAAYDAADAQYRQAVRGARSQELEIARADLETAEATLDTARSALDRTKRLFEGEAVSRREYEEAEDRFRAAETQVANARRRLRLMEEGAGDEELEMARANLDAAARQVDLAELRLSHATIRAPVDGTVARVFAEVGQTVGPESPIAAIVNDRLIYAKIRVPERLYGQFLGRDGRMPVRVLAEAYGDREEFHGTVTTVAPIIDATSRTFEVEVAVPNTDRMLRPGMFVNAVFVLERYPEALHVPVSAVQRRQGGSVVYLEEDGVARERAVQIRPGSEGLSHVLEGLVGDERLIVAGSAFLADGEAVRVIDER